MSSSSSSVATGSTLSALSPAFTMVPTSVRRRASAHTTAAANANSANDPQDTENQRKRRPRPRPRKKKSPSTPTEQSEVATIEAEAAVQEDDKAPAAKPKRKKRPAKKNAATVTVEDQEPEFCLLCADPIKFHAVGECNHHGICSKCSMRMRLLMDDRNCPMCKQPLERVVVSSSPRVYESFELWGDAAGPESVLDEPSEMIFVECKTHYYDLRSLREFGCRMKRCKEMKHSLGQLKEHLHHDHGVEFCELCLKHQSFFIQEQEVFTKGALKGHNIGRSRGGPTGQKHANTGKDFHPMCQFCRKRFYGDKELYEHLERDHFKCHMCKVENEYFRNYASLETHFRREHHLCEDPRCLAMRFVVFPNDVEYQAHMSSIHGVHNRLQFNFQVARNGGNPVSGPVTPGYADDVPDHWNYGVSDHTPSPSVRVEDAFPALPTPSGPAPTPVLRPAITRPPSAYTQGAPPTRRMPTPPRGQIVRNQRLAHALGVNRPGLASGDAAAFEVEMKTPSYPEDLIAWGKANTSYLLVVERRLERIVQEPSCHSVSLRVMSGEERALMHQLASFYNVVSESFGEDPRRRVSFFKREDARVPSVTLSAHISNLTKQAIASRLKFLPLRSSTPPPQAAPKPAAPPVPVSRGWEHIEPRRAPVIADAWSDDEDDGEEGENDGEEEETTGTADIQEKTGEVEEKQMPEQVGESHEDAAKTEALRAKVAAITIDEEEWEQL
ncbi:E3 ubiquitin-protein ligase ZNF598 [Phytophthora ramorum]|uniref:RING-type E3 ubiquitin transferase n=1 Tax=Phytophthora ramorum TaxID=164328 RepID=H3GYY0_PHYRM|nr:E3 ubiquitin-protein ligase ZNF598 [Phytophthora ramorum]